MTNGSSIPVIVGIATGIALIILFSSMFKPDSMLTDEELVSRYSKIPEVSYFLEKYPDANAEVGRNPPDRDLSMRFGVERQVDPPSQFYTGINIFGILVYSNPYHLSLATYCGRTGLTIEYGLSGTGMVEEAEKECFQTSYRDRQFTIAANHVNGKSLGLRQADIVEPEVIDEYWLLKDIISQVNEAGMQESTIVYRNINANATTEFLLDHRLGFAQTCLEIVCYDELSSLINLGDTETSYMIRVFAGEDPFGITGDDDAVTGVFEPDTSGNELGGGVFLTEETNGDTNIEIEYNDG